ncbi:MAG: hypothetical protein Q9196_004546 [Gyalolechia fulgens]
MEQSPVIIAQNHARNAATAPNPAAAGAEHELAAGQFAAAAMSTGHPEVPCLFPPRRTGVSSGIQALRTLKLLEQHHRKLADLLKFRSEHPSPPNPQIPIEHPTANHIALSTAQQSPEGSPYRSQSQTVPVPQRDISSSIASNLASARGIPSNRQRRPQPPPPPSHPLNNQASRTPLLQPLWSPSQLHHLSRQAPHPRLQNPKNPSKDSTQPSNPSSPSSPPL